MPMPGDSKEGFQAQFHRRWHHLTDPHVRDLAWLLDSPDLLDLHAPQWHGQIASLAACMDTAVETWLAELDSAPAHLHDFLKLHAQTRLGRYAERLMAFYFQHMGLLVAHGLQVRAGKNDTIGEFDFLLRQGQALIHWEFATKYYLLNSNGAAHQTGYFVGPNLADTLGAKMSKILDRQLTLGRHPAAQIHLPQELASAQALIKGWLFYHEQDPHPASSLGLSQTHCRGFWCTCAELDAIKGQRYAILPRLSWLAPAKLPIPETIDKESLRQALTTHFANEVIATPAQATPVQGASGQPVLIALMDQQQDYAIETCRGFIVPDDWQSRANQRIHIKKA